MNKKKLICSLLINTFNAVIVTLCIVSFYVSFDGGIHFVSSNCLAYFTNLSAILAAVASLLTAAFCAKNINVSLPLVPKSLSVLKLTAATAEMVTFMVVLCMQFPAMGFSVYQRQDFFLHLITPLLCISSYATLEKSEQAPRRLRLWGMLPTALYTALYLVQVVILQNWMDFYGFNTGGFWYVSLFIINGATYLFASFLWEANHYKKKERSVKSHNSV